MKIYLARILFGDREMEVKLNRSLSPALFFLILILFWGCTKKEEVIRVGSSPTASSSGVFLAYENGHFRDLGLNVEITNFQNSGAPMTVLLANGQLDVGAGNITSGLWESLVQGLDIRIVADKGSLSEQTPYLGLIVRSDHIENGFSELSELNGFKMGLTSLAGVSQQILADRFLQKGGLSMDDVEFIRMSYGEMNVALRQGLIDATIQLEPHLTRAVEEGFAHLFAYGTDVYPDQQSAALFYSGDFYRDTEKATKFMIAYLKGVRDYYNAFFNDIRKEETIAALKKHVNIDDDEIWKKMIPSGINVNGFLNISSLESDLDWYVTNNFISSRPEVARFVDHSFVEAALKALGEK